MQIPRRYSKAVLFTLALVVAACFWRQPYVALLLEACIAVGLLYVSGWHYWKYYVLCALLGASSEILVIYFGAWSYTMPQLLGIPLWLPFVWGNVALFFVSLASHVTTKPRSQ